MQVRKNETYEYICNFISHVWLKSLHFVHNNFNGAHACDIFAVAFSVKKRMPLVRGKRGEIIACKRFLKYSVKFILIMNFDAIKLIYLFSPLARYEREYVYFIFWLFVWLFVYSIYIYYYIYYYICDRFSVGGCAVSDRGMRNFW